MALQDDDLLMIGRPEADGSHTTYRITWAELKNEIQALPFDTPEESDPG